jgi:hypothetical protein
MAVLSNVGFTDQPRNLDQGILVCVNNNGGSTAANEFVADILKAKELLETQAKAAVGEHIWDTYIYPLL